MSVQAEPARVVRRTRRLWLTLAVAVNAPGIAALIGYMTSGLISMLLMNWLELPLLHLFIQLLFIFAGVLAPFTSVLAVPTIGVLALLKKLTDRALLLCVLLTILSSAGALLMHLWWEGKLPMPWVPSR